jgi:hypothetical protein
MAHGRPDEQAVPLPDGAAKIRVVAVAAAPLCVVTLSPAATASVAATTTPARRAIRCAALGSDIPDSSHERMAGGKSSDL